MYFVFHIYECFFLFFIYCHFGFTLRFNHSFHQLFPLVYIKVFLLIMNFDLWFFVYTILIQLSFSNRTKFFFFFLSHYHFLFNGVSQIQQFNLSLLLFFYTTVFRVTVTYHWMLFHFIGVLYSPIFFVWANT